MNRESNIERTSESNVKVLAVEPELQASSWEFGSKPGNCAAKQKRAGLTEQPCPSSPSYSLLSPPTLLLCLSSTSETQHIPSAPPLI